MLPDPVAKAPRRRREVELGTSEPWPQSVRQVAYHGFAGRFVETVEPHSEADPVALLSQLLVAFGNVIGRGPHFIAEADRHSMNLFLGLVGATSKGRKGSSWGHVRHLFAGVDPIWATDHQGSGLVSGEGIIWAVRDSSPAVPEGATPSRKSSSGQHADPGIADKRLLIFGAELSSVLKVMDRSGNTLSTTIRDAWDGRDLRILAKNSPTKATAPHISIVGHITVSELRTDLHGTELTNGFANRYLWPLVKRSKALPDGGNLRDDELESLASMLRGIVLRARAVGRMERQEAAAELWRAVYPELSEGKPGIVGAVTSRAEAQVMRLACIYALLDGSASVRLDHLHAALALWDYFEDSCRFIWGVDPVNRAAARILDRLTQAPEGVLRSELYALFSRHVGAREVDVALNEIEASGQAVRASLPGRGRPGERWFARSRAPGNESAKEANGVPAPTSPALLSLPSPRPQTAPGDANGKESIDA